MSDVTADFLRMRFSSEIANMLRVGRHITKANGEAFMELLENEELYRSIFDKLGYTLLSGASDSAKHTEYFYFGPSDGADVKADTQKKMIALYCAIRVHLQNHYGSEMGGYGLSMVRILNGEASFGADIAQAIMNTHELRIRLARHDIKSEADIDRVLKNMTYYGFLFKEGSSEKYSILPSVHRIEKEFSQIEKRLGEIFNAAHQAGSEGF